jgi:hypothetical protein
LQWRDLEGHHSPQCLPVGGQSSWGIIPTTASSSTATVNTAAAAAAATAATDNATAADSTDRNSDTSATVSTGGAAATAGASSDSGTSGSSRSDRQKPLVLVTAAMDSTSMFHDRSVTENSFFWSFKVFFLQIKLTAGACHHYTMLSNCHSYLYHHVQCVAHKEVGYSIRFL